MQVKYKQLCFAKLRTILCKSLVEDQMKFINLYVHISFVLFQPFFPFIRPAEIVEFFFVDTTPFEDKYFNDPGDDTYDWRGVVPREKYLSSLLKVS